MSNITLKTKAKKLELFFKNNCLCLNAEKIMSITSLAKFKEAISSNSCKSTELSLDNDVLQEFKLKFNKISKIQKLPKSKLSSNHFSIIATNVKNPDLKFVFEAEFAVNINNNSIQAIDFKFSPDLSNYSFWKKLINKEYSEQVCYEFDPTSFADVDIDFNRNVAILYFDIGDLEYATFELPIEKDELLKLYFKYMK